MKTPRHILAQAIAERTLHITDDKLLAREIAAYLLEERRTNELESILRDIMQFRGAHGVLEATIISAHEISETVRGEVTQLLNAAYPSAKTIHVAHRQDVTVIGGIRIDMANEQLDMTVASKLATFKRLLLGEAK